MDTPEPILYTAKATAQGGRIGHAQSDDGRLSVTLTSPKEMGGDGGEGTNPEQLFAAGYSACFLGALKHVASKENETIPDDASITGEVSIGKISTGFALKVTLHIHAKGMNKATLDDLIEKAHIVCPYSNATRGNVDVTLHSEV